MAPNHENSPAIVMPTELESPAALPLQCGTAFTAPYIVVGVRIPDSNMELNNRLPVLSITPEDKACKRRRVYPSSKEGQQQLPRKTQKMQLSVSPTNVYFEAYTGKRSESAIFKTEDCGVKMSA